jgi:L-seryl-tRNA(Ser) seleniumtransferase
VNNNAAAVLLVLSALACGREVIVSRGQLVEIGGSFRIPDVLRQSGATLIEVGTTNKTHLQDYAQCISPQTALILKVHTSNYRIIGFTAEPAAASLAKLAHEYGLPLVDDLGSGTLLPLNINGWQEPTVRERIEAGADIVTFSGDKLLGGSQAGIIVGKASYIGALEHHPLLRAVRIDKLSLAALEGTLLDYNLGEAAAVNPVQRMLRISPSELAEQAAALAARLEFLTAAGWRVSVVEVLSQAGGGSLPGVDLPGYGVGLTHDSRSLVDVEQQLRQRTIPLIARIHDGKIVLDVRCLSGEDYEDVVDAWREIAKGD